MIRVWTLLRLLGMPDGRACDLFLARKEASPHARVACRLHQIVGGVYCSGEPRLHTARLSSKNVTRWVKGDVIGGA
ncbi:hypothetical protein L227DRAFT_310544 [Lentinus tigrinus ALCF2SS1-6]|uniref:Uncharacterized protein n=1 Tax=Lentinus tigrinus ALCF2SS1-6 TaxID=1328759 RepID=A0A5C2RWD1_9APHY|nr:hypothetical protein L227DRAFT_310544 [Lentinus tigrinus ALCF2SS1-6]